MGGHFTPWQAQPIGEGLRLDPHHIRLGETIHLPVRHVKRACVSGLFGEVLFDTVWINLCAVFGNGGELLSYLYLTECCLCHTVKIPKTLFKSSVSVMTTTLAATTTLLLGAEDGIQHSGDDALCVLDFQCQLVRVTVEHVILLVFDLDKAFVVADDSSGELIGEVIILWGGND